MGATGGTGCEFRNPSPDASAHRLLLAYASLVSANSTARSSVPSANAWIERLARLGYASKGVVYLLMGSLSAAAGLGHRHGQIADRKSVIDLIASMPFGRLLLLLMALGVLGYAAWRVISGFGTSEHQGDDAKSQLLRAGSVIRGIFYALFAFGIVRLVMHHGGKLRSSDATSRHWAARAMEHPFGRWLIGGVGLALIGYGLYQFARAARRKLDRHLQWSGVAAATRELLIKVCCFGIAARAVVFGLIGISLIRAALRHDPRAAHGTSGAFREIGGLPFGGWLLTVAALGFVAYGIYAFINARYRSIEPV